MKKRTFLSFMAAAPLSTVLTGCGSNSDGGQAQVRFINVNPSYTGVGMKVDGGTVFSDIEFGSVSGYSDVSSGSIDVTVRASGSASDLVAKSVSLSSDEDYTFVLYGWSGDDAALAYYVENEDTPNSGEATLAVLNASVDAGDLDVFFTGVDDTLDSASSFASSLSGGTRKSPKTVDAGTYRLRVTTAGDINDVRLDVTVTFESQKVYTLLLSPGSSGVLLNGHLLQQGGGLTSLANTQARVRVVSAVSANGKVAMKIDGETLQSATKSPLVADYQLVTAGTVAVVTKVNAVALAEQSLILKAGTDVTLLVTGTDASDATVTAFVDNNRLAASSSFKLRVIHAVPSLSSDNMSLSVGGTSTGTSDIAYGEASAYVTRTAGTDLSVLVETQTTEIYNNDTDDFDSQGVYTAFIWEKPSSSDANALQVKFYADR